MASKRNRRRRAKVAARAAAVNGGAVVDQVATPPVPVAFSNYDGANRSPRRGHVRWTSLDTRHELNAFDRAELLRRCRWLRANVGLVKGLVKNGAMLIGWMTPSTRSTDEDWNQIVDKNFRFRAGSPAIFDASGKFNFKTAQRMMMERVLCDGDILTVLARTDSGGARAAFFEAHQFQSPPNADPKVWQEGVRTNASGRHLVYGVGDRKRVTTISARDAIYFGRFESIGHNRAHPPLSHAINHAIDITEVWGDTKHGIKNSALLGIVSEFDGNVNGSNSVNGMDIIHSLPTGIPNTQEVGDAAGNKVNISEIFGGGQMPAGAPGEKFKILTDSRPHPNQREFVFDLIRDISVGYGLPPEVIWHMTKLTGPGVRYIMEVASRWIEEWQLELIGWCHRYWVFHVAREIKEGRIPEPMDPDWMQSVQWTPRRSLTIDRGKDGKQRLDEIASGVGTLADWYADVDGEHWHEKVRQTVRERTFKTEEAKKAGFTFEQVFPPRQGAAAVEPTPPPAPEK